MKNAVGTFRLGTGRLPMAAKEPLRSSISRSGRVAFVRAQSSDGASTSGNRGPSPSGRPLSPFGKPKDDDKSRGDMSDTELWGKDWDDWDETPNDPGQYQLDDWTTTPQSVRQRIVDGRDSFISPIYDFQTFQERFTMDDERTENNLRLEFRANQWESTLAMKFLAILIGIPLLTGWGVSTFVADPILRALQADNAGAFTLTAKQKVRAAKEIHVEEERLRFEAGIGQAPSLNEDELEVRLRQAALHIAKEFRDENRHALENIISDFTAGSVGFFLLLKDRVGREVLFRTIGRVFGGLSDTAKAFIIIAMADIFLGYHSEEGWFTLVNLVSEHYGFQPDPDPVSIFVAIVPVTFDTWFKYYLFINLNKMSPATVATLKMMDRH